MHQFWCVTFFFALCTTFVSKMGLIYHSKEKEHQMKQVKQINDIQIKVTKEEIARTFVKYYKYDKWNLYTEKDVAKEILKKCMKMLIILLLVVGVAYLLFWCPAQTDTSTTLATLDVLVEMLTRLLFFMLPLLLILMGSSLIMEMSYGDIDVSDFFGPSISELKDGLDNYYELCKLLETDFQHKTVEELLKLNYIKKSNDQLELMSNVLDGRIEICKKDSGELVARDISTNRTSFLDIDSKSIKKNQSYNLIIGLGENYLAKAEVEKTNEEELEDSYEAFFSTL